MLKRMLANLIKIGRLTVIDANGERFCVGDVPGDAPQLDIVVRLVGRFTGLKLVLHPELYLGEAYMDGKLTIERGSLWHLLDLYGRNLQNRDRRTRSRLARIGRSVACRLQQHNSRRAARRNAAHHYDLSYDLYRQFLDRDMQYSCAYFAELRMTLDEAQEAKKRHIAAKLALAPGQRVLDIGCGFGGLALSLAREKQAHVTGITLSRQQLAVAKERAAGLADKVSFELSDYREIEGPFDRIVSVGMFEHVGAPNYQTFFDKLARLLTEDGVALIHSIGRADEPALTDPWIRKYIFPGGYIPALSEVLPAVERAGLWVTDIEILRLHYAETLRLWRERFLKNRSQIRTIYDDRFCRMWEFYLAGSEMAFRYDNMMVIQLQLTRRVDSLPITRDYMFEAEQDMARCGERADPSHRNAYRSRAL
jgi:cyclopropane-fatty-acyl-phospholipid synthase